MTNNRGMTAVEILVVCALVALILGPIISILVSSQQSATAGYDKLEMLGRARFIMERVQRDLKALCSANSYGFLPIATETMTFSIPVFPTQPKERTYSTNYPLNIVTYVFDPRVKTLTRNIKYHASLAPGGNAETSETLGSNVASFSICPRKMLKMRFYDVEVACESSQPNRQDNPIILRTSVRSEYESRLERHPYLLSNRQPQFSFPPD